MLIQCCEKVIHCMESIPWAVGASISYGRTISTDVLLARVGSVRTLPPEAHREPSGDTVTVLM